LPYLTNLDEATVITPDLNESTNQRLKPKLERFKTSPKFDIVWGKIKNSKAEPLVNIYRLGRWSNWRRELHRAYTCL